MTGIWTCMVQGYSPVCKPFHHGFYATRKEGRKEHWGLSGCNYSSTFGIYKQGRREVNYCSK